MKRIFAVFATLALMAGMAMAQPSMYGSYGLVRTISPENAGAMNFGIGVHGFLSMKEVETTTSWRNIELYPKGYFAVSDMLEFSLSPAYRMFQTTISDSSVSDNGSLDTRIGLKASFKLGESFDLGTYLGYDYRYSKKFSGKYAWVDNAWKLKSTDTLYSPIGTFHFLLIPGFQADKFKAHLNVGVAYDLDKVHGTGADSLTAVAVYPQKTIPFGLGLSYDAGMMTPFLEVTGSHVMDDTKYGKITGYDTLTSTPIYGETVTRGLMNNPLWVTAGARFAFGDVKLDVGGEYNLQTKDSTLPDLDRELDWQVFLGLAYAPTKAAGPKVPPTALLTGKVTDAKGKGLAATVTAGGLTANTDPATGDYTLAGLPITKAPIEIKTDAKLYIAKSGSVILTKKNKKTPAVQDFALELKPIPMGAAKGLVKDAVTLAPVEASIAFAGPKAETAKVVAGAYNVNLQVGNYAATVTAVGYFDKTATIAIAEKGAALNDFTMLKKGAVLPVEVVWTAANKAMIKTVNVEALVKMLQDNPKAKVVITAYVDRVGGKKMNQKLATARADAIRAELVKAAIDVARITTVGQLPVVASKTNALRAANTKVEVSFVE
ncbi:OmpA family protein [candidate division TA06 bacterium]|uniref:OmpA family protein n=1 Tax=candidate division TA06 bacterium TaxID=2250710 RepID=A0A933IA23_UNCT6|nr:OmpA family protein [candidate division TA06 bacterium]